MTGSLAQPLCQVVRVLEWANLKNTRTCHWRGEWLRHHGCGVCDSFCCVVAVCKNCCKSNLKEGLGMLLFVPHWLAPYRQPYYSELCPANTAVWNRVPQCIANICQCKMCHQAIKTMLWTMASENMPGELRMERGPRPQGDWGSLSYSYQYIIKQRREGFHIRRN